jgi:methyl-accepting chemotaxis protein
VAVGTRLAHEAGTTMNDVVQSVRRVNSIIADITTASREQIAGVDQVDQAIAQIDTVTQRNAALVEEAAAATQALQEQAMDLERVVGVFKI